MSARRGLILAAVVLVLAAVGWYLLSPAYTLRQIKAAANRGDSQALAAFVDFPALRADVKSEVAGRLAFEAGRQRHGLGGLGFALGSIVAGPAVDAMVSPEGLRAVFLASRSPAATGGQPGLGIRLGDKPVIRRRGLSEFTVSPADDPKVGLVFRRDGLGWKLAGVDLSRQREASDASDDHAPHP